MAGTAPSDSNCLAYYKMEDGSDETDNENDLSVVGANFLSNGIINKGGTFDGDDDYANTGLTISLTDSKSLSISVWVISNEDSLAYSTIVGTLTEGGSIDPAFLIGASDTVNAKPRFEVKTDTDSVTYRAYADSNIDDGEFHHLVGVLDGVNDEIRFYVDGSLADTVSVSDDTLTVSKSFYIGALNLRGTASQFFDGVIDELLVYSDILTSSNIEFLYNNGSPGSDQQYPFSGVTPTDYGTLKRYNGSTFVSVDKADRKYYNGSSFVAKPMKAYDGTSFKEVGE